jgi:hypothetical protein
MSMKTIKLYFVANQYRAICGPFRDKEVAETWAKRYSNHFWGECHVEEKEVSEQ